MYNVFYAQVIDHMLNIQECPKKPQYGMAPGNKNTVFNM